MVRVVSREVTITSNVPTHARPQSHARHNEEKKKHTFILIDDHGRFDDERNSDCVCTCGLVPVAHQGELPIGGNKRQLLITGPAL